MDLAAGSAGDLCGETAGYTGTPDARLHWLQVQHVCYYWMEDVTLAGHCFYRQPGEGIQIGPNWDLSKALNNRYRLPAPPASPAPGHFGVLLIKMHLLAFVVVAIKWIIRPKTKKNLFS